MVVVWSSYCHLLSDIHELAHMYLLAQKFKGSTGEGGGEKGHSMAGGKEDDEQGLKFGNVRPCIIIAISSLLIVLLYQLSYRMKNKISPYTYLLHLSKLVVHW